MKIEFLYDKKKDKTQIYVWDGTALKDTLDMNGVLTSFVKEKIRDELFKKHKAKK